MNHPHPPPDDPTARLRVDPAVPETDDDAHGTRAGAVPVGVIRQKIGDLQGRVTTHQILEQLRANGATPAELATMARLEEREWDDLDQAFAATSSGFTSWNR